MDLAPYNTSAVIGGNATLACLVSDKQSSENVKWYVVSISNWFLFVRNHSSGAV